MKSILSKGEKVLDEIKQIDTLMRTWTEINCQFLSPDGSIGSQIC